MMLTGLPAEVRPDTSSLRYVVCGAAPMPALAIRESEDRYEVPIVEGYGQSEGTVVTTANAVTGMRKPGTVGLPLPGQEVRVVGRDDQLGWFDHDGYLVLVDRVKDMIIRGGENIYPKEIEDALYTHPGVLEAAVVTRPHPVFGEEPVAFVVLRPGLTADPDELIGHCRSRLAKYKVPRAVFIKSNLPKTAIGKIAKTTLREGVSPPTSRTA